MTKQKYTDYFGAVCMGGIWTVICLAINTGIWYILNQTSDNKIFVWALTILFFLFALSRGREFFIPEVREARKDDPKTDWLGFLDNLQLVCIAAVFINSMTVFQEGFTWLGLGVLICSWLFVGLTLYLKNTRFGK